MTVWQVVEDQVCRKIATVFAFLGCSIGIILATVASLASPETLNLVWLLYSITITGWLTGFIIGLFSIYLNQ